MLSLKLEAKTVIKSKYEWSSRRAKTLSEIFPENNLAPGLFDHVISFTQTILGDYAISLEFVSSTRLSAFVTHRDITPTEQQSALFFDLTQSWLLKKIFAKIGRGDNYINVAETLKLAGSLAILDANCNYAGRISIVEIKQDNSRYRCDLPELEYFQRLLLSSAELFNRQYFDKFIDYFLISHEVSHYLFRIKVIPEYFISSSKTLFDNALELVCYENSPHFEKIFMFGLLAKNEMDFSEQRNRLSAQREYYIGSKDHITEEIMCDYYSYKTLFDTLVPSSASVEEIINFNLVFFIAFYLLDLQKQSKLRIEFSAEKTKHDTLPSNLSDFHLRKVAMTEAMKVHFLELLKNRDVTEIKRNEFSEKLSQEILLYKRMLDHLYVIPVISTINGCLNYIEPDKNLVDIENKALCKELVMRDIVLRKNLFDLIF